MEKCTKIKKNYILRSILNQRNDSIIIDSKKHSQKSKLDISSMKFKMAYSALSGQWETTEKLYKKV